MKSAKRKRGRPPKHEGERLSGTRTFRVRGLLDRLLKQTAQKNERSVSEEIEYRLNRSFYLDGVFTSIKGREAQLVQMLVAAVTLTANANPAFAGHKPPEEYPAPLLRILKITIGIILDALAGTLPPDSDVALSEIQAELKSGLISAVEATERVGGYTIAHELLAAFGIIKGALRGNISQLVLKMGD